MGQGAAQPAQSPYVEQEFRGQSSPVAARQAHITSPVPRPGERGTDRNDASRASNNVPGGYGGQQDPFAEPPRAGSNRPTADLFAPFPAGDFGGSYANSTDEKSQELCQILKSLEGLLEAANDFEMIGKTYRGLAEWTWEHSQDSDFGEVLASLAPESMYPAWRRQALEEAYMLFFEDCAKQGNPKALNELPEPPTSREIGYRPLPEALIDPKTTRGAAFSNTYEVGNACCIRRRWDYDVIRNGPRPRPGEKRAAGRKIVAKDSTSRYCTCATAPLSSFAEAFTPEWICCGRDRKAEADKEKNGKGKPDEPQWPPAPTSGNSPRSATAANAPSASTKLKPKPFRSEVREVEPSAAGNFPSPLNQATAGQRAALARDQIPRAGSI